MHPCKKLSVPSLLASRPEGPGRVTGCIPFLLSPPGSSTLNGICLGGGGGDGVSGLPPAAEPSRRRSSASMIVLHVLLSTEG